MNPTFLNAQKEELHTLRDDVYLVSETLATKGAQKAIQRELQSQYTAVWVGRWNKSPIASGTATMEGWPSYRDARNLLKEGHMRNNQTRCWPPGGAFGDHADGHMR